jgi:YbgC/YbaW family acyl-CoA thioester hydrolase
MRIDLPTVADFRFLHTLRVRWAEVDMQKIVFNGHYLMYFDTAVAEYWRALAWPYEEGMHELGGDLYVAKATIEYKASARYDDRLQVGMRVHKVGHSSITFTGAIFAEGKLLVTGELIYVYADPATQKSKPVPSALRELFSAYEAGQAMTELVIGSWAELGPKALLLRNEVFVAEQGVPAEIEHDELDASCVHAVIFNRMGQALATGRLIAGEGADSRHCKIGRMAVKRVLRGSELGRSVLQGLLGEARRRGDSVAVLHAQLSAKDFYAKQGFAQEGEVFEEAGIAHITMRLALTPSNVVF